MFTCYIWFKVLHDLKKWEEKKSVKRILQGEQQNDDESGGGKEIDSVVDLEASYEKIFQMIFPSAR